jgi:hypothetical protein
MGESQSTPQRSSAQVSAPQQYRLLGLPVITPAQSPGQLRQSSPLLQVPLLLQTAGCGGSQSAGQVSYVSSVLQTWSPQTLPDPQSTGHDSAVSSFWHLPSPQTETGFAAHALADINIKDKSANKRKPSLTLIIMPLQSTDNALKQAQINKPACHFPSWQPGYHLQIRGFPSLLCNRFGFNIF